MSDIHPLHSASLSKPLDHIKIDNGELTQFLRSETNKSTDFGQLTQLVTTKSTDFGSIYIKEVGNHIKLEFIFKKLCLLNIGYIHKITEVPCKIHQGFKRIFIRIRWNTETHTIDIRNKLLIGETIKIVYDIPWFWVLCESCNNYVSHISAVSKI